MREDLLCCGDPPALAEHEPSGPSYPETTLARSPLPPYSYQPYQAGSTSRSWSLPDAGSGLHSVPGIPPYSVAMAKKRKVRDKVASPGLVPPARAMASRNKNIEICEYSDNDWIKQFSLPIRINDDTANVENVTKMVSDEAFNGEPIVLVDTDYLRILDTPGTRGKLKII